MNTHQHESSAAPRAAVVPRLFLHEPGWTVRVKHGSDRAFCHMIAPGQNYYHRLLDGEIYLQHADDKICLQCADRRGLFTLEPKRLREPASESVVDEPSGFDYDMDEAD